jgi:hypothetical protein
MAESEERAREEGQVPDQPGQVWRTQRDYKGREEKVDAYLHTHKLTCPICGEVRWVAPGDLFQVDACKPCVEARRREKRNARARRKRLERRMAKAAAQAPEQAQTQAA